MSDEHIQQSEQKLRYKHDYINNLDFFNACSEYIFLMRKCREEGKEDPIISEYIGKCFLDISTHMAYRHNFRGYTWIGDMIGDAVLNCVQALPSFNPEASKKNAFGYFSKIIFRAFLRRIKTENTKTKTRLQICEFLDIDLDEIEGYDGNSSDTYQDENNY